MDFITQQNMLRGLSEEQLKTTMSGGNTPPFLVLGEINRRDTMRRAYAGEMARRGKQTTVFEELTGGAQPPDPTVSGMRMPQLGQLPEQAMPTTAPQAFADGGLVHYADGGMIARGAKKSGVRGMDEPSPGSEGLSALIDRYTEQLDGVGERKDDAMWMALAAAGANMMSGKSSNFMTNVGTGATAGLDSYRTLMGDAEESEQGSLDALLRLQTTQSDMDYRERMANADERRHRDTLTLEQQRLAEGPASVEEYEFFKKLDPQGQADFLRLNPPGGAGTDYAEIARRQSAFNGIYEDALKAAKETAKYDLRGVSDDPAKQAALMQQIETQARQKALTDFKVLYPEYKDWAEVYGQQIASTGQPGSSLGPVDNDPAGIR